MKQPLFHLKNSMIVLALFIAQSCTQSNPAKTVESQEFTEAEQKILNDITQVLRDMPPPSVIPTTLQTLGATYDESLLHDLDSVDKYGSNIDKSALILGVYATDVAYLVAYDQIQSSLAHLDACQKMAENLGISSAFDMETLRKFEENLSNHDSLISILNQTIYIARERLHDGDQLSKVGLSVTGSFIEGLFIVASTIENYHNKNMSRAEEEKILEPAVKLLIDQEKPLLDVIKLLDELPIDATIASVLTELDVLELLYQEDIGKIREELTSNPDAVITKSMMEEVIYEIKRVRKKLIELS